MVTRKPVGPPLATAEASSSSNTAPPYPTTPTKEEPKTASSVYSEDLKTSPAFDLIDMNEARQRTPRRDSDVSSHGTWDDSDRDEDTPEDEVEVPKPLNFRASQQNINEAAEEHKQDELPAILKPGPANGVSGVGTRAAETRQYEEESQGNPWQLESNNPYLQKSQQRTGQNGYIDNSQKVWEQPAQQRHDPPPPSQAPPSPPQAAPPVPPVELSAVKPPTEEMSRMSLGEHRDSAATAASWETAEILNVPQKGRSPLSPVARVPSADAQAFPSSNPWSEGALGAATPPVAPPKEALTPTDQRPPSCYEPPPGPPPGTQAEPQYPPPPGPPPGQAGPLIDHSEAPRPPPISTQVQPPPSVLSPEPGLETPGTRDKRKRNEIYQIKHVNWYDSASGKAGMRRSPVLTQNENGPCPLLALVNALVLSTPAGLDTPLTEALRTRETISLGFLLDGVFDELMSGRRGDTAHALPDVSELYSFLLALHTGMNVNPRFITPAATPRGSLDGHPPELHGVHPTERSQQKAGCFEETREMRLYSTFNIPLIHGWTAPKDTPAYQAFQRTAQTFEDAQNIQFAEPELEDKLRTEGLDFKEQQLLEDIQTIKGFLQTWPTQLTDYGLETISRSLQPGQLAILFRNDHFSTLYKEPRHGALMTLVTDAGYSSHDEIVWESLVDVNGAASEMFSGDFRPVSHKEDARLNQSSSGGGNDGWQTAQSRNRYHKQRPSGSRTTGTSSEETPPPLPGPRPAADEPNQGLGASQSDAPLSASEQEDHDLALALQMQEEEEEQQRQAESRRRREQELSEQFLSSEERPPAIPPRRNQSQNQNGRSPGQSTTNIPVTGGQGRTHAPNPRSAVNRPGANDDPDAPPTYEQSASDRPYRPAGATAPPTQGNPLTTLDALRRQQSAYAQQSTTSVNSTGMASQHGRRQSQGTRIQRRSSQLQGQPGQAPPYSPGRPPPQQQVGGAPTIRDADERCVIM